MNNLNFNSKLKLKKLLEKDKKKLKKIFPYEVKVSNKDVDVIINVTNDTWYGNSSGPYQHFEISRMRAIENGLPMLRVANNGISGFIDPVGRILEKTETATELFSAICLLPPFRSYYN